MKPAAFYACLTLCVIAPTTVSADFIDNYLAAKRYCGPLFPNPTTLLTVQSGLLFGKAPADWTDAEVAHLPDALKRCVHIASNRGVQLDLGGPMTDTLNDRDFQGVVAIVAAAKSEKMVSDLERTASQKADQDAAKQASDKAILDRRKAEEGLKEAEAAKVAATKDAEDKIAKDKALIAAAHTRREAALAHQQALAMEAETEKAAAEAEAAEAAERRALIAAAEAKARHEKAVADNRFERAHPSIVAPSPSTVVNPKIASAGDCDVTYEQYQSLRNGMSYREAAEALGCLGTEMSRLGPPNQTIVMYDWTSKVQVGGNMTATFQGNQMVNKAQFGLK